MLQRKFKKNALYYFENKIHATLKTNKKIGQKMSSSANQRLM